MRLLRWAWNNFEDFFGGICLAGIVILVFINVCMRYIFNNSIYWVSEVSTILFVWMVMLGVGSAALRRMHPGIDALVTIFPAKAKIVIQLIANVLVIYLLTDFTVRSWNFAVKLGWVKLTGALELHYTFIYIAVPIGFGLMLIRTVVATIVDFRKLRNMNYNSSLNQSNDPHLEEGK